MTPAKQDQERDWQREKTVGAALILQLRILAADVGSLLGNQPWAPKSVHRLELVADTLERVVAHADRQLAKDEARRAR